MRAVIVGVVRIAFAIGLTLVGLVAVTRCGSSGSSSPAGSGVAWAHLVVIYRPHGRYPVPGQADPAYRWSLRCGPPGGDHPARAVACVELIHHKADLSVGRPQCQLIARGAPSARVTGDVLGAPIDFVASACAPAWRTLPALLTGSIPGG